jgi:glutaredoxin
MVLKILAVVLVLFLIYVWMTYYNLSGVHVVRYSRPDCPFCVESESDWKDVKLSFESRSQVDKSETPVKFVDVNTSNDLSLDTQLWKSKYKPESVPQVIVVINDNIEEYKGPDNKFNNIVDFINNIINKYKPVIKK